MHNTENEKIEKVTMRNAASFGFHLAHNLADHLSSENVIPSNWPEKFPITTKQIAKLPEVNKNTKLARRVRDAALIIWDDMRTQALEVEKDMALHPELYDMSESIRRDRDHAKDWAWRHLHIEMEQVAGNLYITEFVNDDDAKYGVYGMISPHQLKQYIIDFEDDYKPFIDEVRETIRERKELKASEKFDLICSLNRNNQLAYKLIAKEQTKKVKSKTKNRKKAKSSF